ncbi:MAG: hypothetical protein HY321_04415 [Armatimonadetes bacterium]|nr:hypothetical protein [Armatimonadota bacterium]
MTTSGKVVALTDARLSLSSGAQFRLAPATTRLSDLGGEVNPENWGTAFGPGDAVTVIHDGKGTALSVVPLAAFSPSKAAPARQSGAPSAPPKPAAPAPRAPAVPATPAPVTALAAPPAPGAAQWDTLLAAPKPLPAPPGGHYTVMGASVYTPGDQRVYLVWMRASDGTRRLYELDAATRATGEGISGTARGVAAVQRHLARGAIVRITLSSRRPSVGYFGPEGGENVVHGRLQTVRVVKAGE